jgi:hypothetical protein
MMKQRVSTSLVGKIMIEFARMTGLSPTSSVPRRYLWTDAFAVCNFLGLYQETGGKEFKDLALQVVDQVHSVLGRHRHDDQRVGWISGLEEQDGRLHPTKGGLRIGKQLKERRPADPLDEGSEWDRDGQYYHYLTKWMHALNRAMKVTGDFTYNRWAIELAKVAHSKFVYAPSPGGQKRMYWKMSIDLSYPLVPSMGLHDPLDGVVTYSQLQATAAEDPEQSTTDLKAEIADMADMCKGKSWATDDLLGIGGLLSDAFRVAQLMVKGHFAQKGLLGDLLDASLVGLKAYAKEGSFRLPPDYRLAFRELGLSIGLAVAERLLELLERNERTFGKGHDLKVRMKALNQYGALTEVIHNFWLQPENQEAESWMTHRHINMVMLATSLAPDGYLTL